MRHLVCECTGGLGNRLASVVAGLVAAKKTRRKLIVVWSTQRRCMENTRLTDLYECPGFEIRPKLPRSLVRKPRVFHDIWETKWGKPFSVAGSAPLVHLHCHGFLRCIECSDRQELRNTWLTRFRPVVGIRRQVKEIIRARFRGRHVIAVQLRMLGHKNTAQWNPWRHFVEMMGYVNKHRPKTAVFLSCDCPKMAKRFTSRGYFPNPAQLIMLPVPRPNSLRALKKTVTDIELCVSAQEFYGSYFSALSEWISFLRNDAIKLMSDFPD